LTEGKKERKYRKGCDRGKGRGKSNQEILRRKVVSLRVPRAAGPYKGKYKATSGRERRWVKEKKGKEREGKKGKSKRDKTLQQTNKKRTLRDVGKRKNGGFEERKATTK